MSQHGSDASSHPDEPPTKRRTLQIKLGRPRPPSGFQQAEQASPSLNRSKAGNGIRISLKRKASVPESQFAPPRFAVHHADDEDEDDGEDDGEDHAERQLVGTTDASDAEEDEEGEDDDEESGADDDREGGEDDEDEEEGAEEDMQHEQDGNTEEQQDTTAEGLNGSALDGDAASNPRIRGKNGAFQSTGASSANPNRRPIKRLRSKGLYEALPKLIDNLLRRDNYKFFSEPVNLDEVPGYTDVIKTPMDFGTMLRKVNDRLYSHMDEFKADFQLVVNNAMTFNPEGTLYYNEAKRIAAWGNRAIEREGMAVNDNGRAGAKGDEIRRQKRLAREAAASSSAITLDGESASAIGEGQGRRQLRGTTLQHQQALDSPSLQQLAERQGSLGIDVDDLATRSAARGSRFAFSAGVQALMEAARVTSQARQRAAIALGLTGGTMTREDSVQLGGGGEDDDMDVDEDDDMDEDASDEEAGVRASVARGKSRESRERSVTVDGAHGSVSRRLGSTQPTGTPSTPMGQRQASPDALRKRLAAVTGTPIQALASPMGPPTALTVGTNRASKNVKHKQRLGAPGTPKRLLVRSDFTGPTTPLASASADAGGPPLDSSAAAAQLIATMSQAQVQPAVASYSFDDDGSINPHDIDDLHAFLTLHRSGKHVLMPSIESLYPIPFIPGDYTSSGPSDKDKEQDKDKDRAKEKDKAKDKGAADDADDDDEDGKGDAREKGDKDPLSTLPPSRPGAPDPLYSAIAPEPESMQSNLSHDVDPLPPHFRHLPFHTPSLHVKSAPQSETFGVPCSWTNPAYVEALKNDKRPKKQKDKEREKEREMLEDWSYFRPTLTRLLEITDLGPFSALVPPVKDNKAGPLAKSSIKSKAAKGAKQAEASSALAPELSTALLSEEGLQAMKAQLSEKRQCAVWPREILKRYTAAAQAGDNKASENLLSQAEQHDASRIVSDLVYPGVTGQAYIRSLGEFVGGASDHPLLLDEIDDAADVRVNEAERDLLLAAAMRKIDKTEGTPEPTAASRRGPFMWRDTTEEVGGTATPSGPNDGEAGQPDMRASVDAAADAAEEANKAQSAISDLLKDLQKVEAQLAPLPKSLAEVVEEEVIRPLTGNTLDILHLVASLLKAPGSDSVDVKAIEARLLQGRIRPHQTEAVHASRRAAPPASQMAPVVAPTSQPSQQPGTPLPPVPFTAELDWLKDQPHLTQLLDEARHDVDSLGSIVNYIIQSA